MKFLVLVAVLAMSSLAFAQSECEESCCYASGGSWDEYGYCEDADTDYYNCINQCEGSAGVGYSCCGPAFMLVGLVGAVFFLKN